MEPKNICIVSAQYLPHVGGVENFVAHLSAELIRRGHRVTILTSAVKGLPAWEQTDAVEIFRLPTWQLMNGRFPVLRKGRTLRRMTGTIREKHFDVMLVNVRFYPLSLYAVKLAEKMNCPCYLMDHGAGHVAMGGKLTTWLGERYEHAITAMEKKHCRHYLGVSSASVRWLEHFGIRADGILRNAISVEQVEAVLQNPPRSFREEYNVPSTDKVIAFVGRLVEGKGVLELHEAFLRLFAERSDVWLLLAGDGNLRKAVEKSPCPHVICLGAVPHSDVIALHRESDLFVFPSESEGFPTAILEAAVCRDYLITTDVGDAREIVRTPGHGIILPSNAPKEIYAAIHAVIDRPDLRETGTELCYREVTDRFTWQKTADAFLALLNKEGTEQHD